MQKAKAKGKSALRSLKRALSPRSARRSKNSAETDQPAATTTTPEGHLLVPSLSTAAHPPSPEHSHLVVNTEPSDFDEPTPQETEVGVAVIAIAADQIETAAVDPTDTTQPYSKRIVAAVQHHGRLKATYKQPQVHTAASQGTQQKPQDTARTALLDGSALAHDDTKLQKQSKIVRIFLSSTFTDTKHERDLFNVWAVPRLRELCNLFGLEFQQSEMRWGIDDMLGQSHQTSAICMRELHRCIADSVAINFVGFLFDKYGYRPFPATISPATFENLKQAIQSLNNEQHKLVWDNIIEKWFILDSNQGVLQGGTVILRPVVELLPNYILAPNTDADRSAKQAAVSEWWSTFEKMQQVLRDAALVLLKNEQLSPHEANLFIQSVTAEEMGIGIVGQATEDSAVAQNAVLVLRSAQQIKSTDSAAKLFVDQDANGNVDTDAQERLDRLKDLLSGKVQPHHLIQLRDVTWQEGAGFDPLNNAEHAKSLREVMTRLWGVLSDSVCAAATRLAETAGGAHAEPLLDEVRHHTQFLEGKARSFAGRQRELSQICNGMRQRGNVVVVHGLSGSGKTSLLAKAVRDHVCETTSSAPPVASVGEVRVVRFLGTTPATSTAAGLVRSIMQQIYAAYNSPPALIPPPDSTPLAQLGALLPRYLGLASAKRPLLLVLDSLDQLSDAEGGRQLQWLPLPVPVSEDDDPDMKPEFPPHVTLVLSSLPEDDYQCLPALRTRLAPLLQASAPSPKAVFVDVEPLRMEDAAQIIDGWLAAEDRGLTPQQREFVLAACTATSLPSAETGTHATPLLLRLLYQISRSWRSDTVVPEGSLPTTTPAAINRIFDDIERTYNPILTRRTLAFLTAARDGVSANELADLVSSEDDVLDSCFEWWLPPVARVPPLMMTRLLTALQDFVVERGVGTNGEALLGWYHRQFWEVAESRYLNPNDRATTHSSMAEYFEGKWSTGKPYTAKGKFGQFASEPTDPNRQLPAQPLFFITVSHQTSNPYAPPTTSVPNHRRLREHVHHVFESGRIEDAARLILQLEYITAKLTAQSFGDLLGEAKRVAAGLEAAPPGTMQDQTLAEQLKELVRFLRSRLELLKLHPGDWLLQAANGPAATFLSKRAKAELRRAKTPFWEWANRPENFDPLLITFTGHANPVNDCAITPDGKRAVSCSYDLTVRIWDLETGVQLKKLQGHMREIYRAQFSPNGKKIVSGGADQLVIIWDVDSGAMLSVLQGHDASVLWCSFSPSGDSVVSTAGGMIYIWDLTTNSISKKLQGHTAYVWQAVYSPDGSKILSCSKDHTVRVWDVQQGVELHCLTAHQGEVRGCVFSRDGKLAATAGDDNCVRLWDTSTWENTKTFVVDSMRGIWGCDLSPDSTRVAASGGRTIVVWDVTTEEKLYEFEGHSDDVYRCRFTPDGSQVLSSSGDKTLRLWDAISPSSPNASATRIGRVQACCFARDGRHALTCSNDKVLRIWDVEQCVVVKELHGHTEFVFACNYSPDGTLIASGGIEKVIRIWDVESGQEVKQLKGGDSWIKGCAFSKDNNRLLSCDNGPVFYLWDTQSEKRIQTFKGHVSGVVSCWFSADETWVVSGGADRFVKIWDVATGQELRSMQHHTLALNCAKFTHDFKYILTSGFDGEVIAYDTEDEFRVTRILSTRNVSSIDVSPEGIVMAACGDGTVRFVALPTHASRTTPHSTPHRAIVGLGSTMEVNCCALTDKLAICGRVDGHVLFFKRM